MASCQTVTNDPPQRQTGSRRLILAAGSGAGARWDLGLPAAALYRLKAPHEEGRAQPVARIPGLDGSIGRRRIGSGSAGVATLIPRWMT